MALGEGERGFKSVSSVGGPVSLPFTLLHILMEPAYLSGAPPVSTSSKLLLQTGGRLGGVIDFHVGCVALRCGSLKAHIEPYQL